MLAEKIVQIGAYASILSGFVWLALTPVMATIGICQGTCPFWESQPLVIRPPTTALIRVLRDVPHDHWDKYAGRLSGRHRAFRHVSWLEAGSVKVALSRPIHQRCANC